MPLLQGDNQYRVSGQALEFKKLNIHAWEAFVKGQDIHMQAAPSQAELLYKNFRVIKDKLKSQMKDAIMEKYGNAATEEVLPKELLLGQSEKPVEYDRAGRVVTGMVYMKLNSFSNNQLCFWILPRLVYIYTVYVLQKKKKGLCFKSMCVCMSPSVCAFQYFGTSQYFHWDYFSKCDRSRECDIW